MKYYEDFLKSGCFTFKDAVNIIGNDTTAKTILQSYVKKGYIAKIKKGLYTTVNLVDKEPVANKFLIASKITDTAVVSHHSAFEFYGYTNQVSYDVTVTSLSKFNTFEFNGFTYTRLQPSIYSGVVRTANGERITNIERTVLDSINDFDKNMGFEELIKCISAIPLLNTENLLFHLDLYDKCFLYQKTGFILEHFKSDFDIDDSFFEICKKKSGNSSRYLMKDISKGRMDFNNFWHLTIPQNLWQNTLGGDENAYV